MPANKEIHWCYHDQERNSSLWWHEGLLEHDPNKEDLNTLLDTHCKYVFVKVSTLSQLIYVMIGQLIIRYLHMVSHNARGYTMCLTKLANMWGVGCSQGSINSTTSEATWKYTSIRTNWLNNPCLAAHTSSYNFATTSVPIVVISKFPTIIYVSPIIIEV